MYSWKVLVFFLPLLLLIVICHSATYFYLTDSRLFATRGDDSGGWVSVPYTYSMLSCCRSLFIIIIIF